MNDNKTPNQQSQQGTGSAEHKDQSRTAQQNTSAEISEQEKQDIASQVKEPVKNITDIRGVGGMSGRDDAAGGAGERMDDESTGKPTDR
jgi:hypothetical protein